MLVVGYFHKKNIIFRDLKPDNVLVDQDGHIRLTDIGIAFTLTGDNKCTRVIGAEGYKAPEMLHQAKDKSGIVHHLLCG